MEEHDDVSAAGRSDPWAARAASSLALAQTMSKILFVGAGLALGLGVLAAMLTYTAMDTTASWGEAGTFISTGGSLALSQSASTVVSSLLPAGVLAAAAVAVRLQALRFETEFLGR